METTISEKVRPVDCRYRQTREESAELLRGVLGKLASHAAVFTPFAFAVWYEYLAGINPRLKAALDERSRRGPLDDLAMCRLYRQHVAEVDPSEAERVGDGVERVMLTIADSAASTSQTTQDYGEQLAALERSLVSGEPEELAPRLNAALAATRQVTDSLEALRRAAVGGQQELRDLREQLERYRVEAVTDSLTRLLNRKGFDEQMETVLSQRPPQGTDHWLIIFDIDHFKRINDTHGHLVGDSVLQTLGDILRRATDGIDGACARYGGEEFAILLRATTRTSAAQLAQSICALCRTTRVRNRSTQEIITTVTVSAGVAAWQPGERASDLIACADAALYRSKEMGRDRVTVA